MKKRCALALLPVLSCSLLHAAIDAGWIARAVDDDERQSPVAVPVSAGQTNTMRQLSLRTDTTRISVVKSGEGMLEIGGVALLDYYGYTRPAGGSFDVTVSGGGFGVLPAVSPAGGGFDAAAYIHVDASAEGAFDSYVEGGVEYVRTWRDLRGENAHSVAGGYDAGKPTKFPALVESAALGGRKVVDLGVYAEGANISESTGTSYLVFDGFNVREGFFVMRQKEAGANGAQPFFLGVSSDSYPFHRGDDGWRILSGQNAAEHARGGVWHVDGCRVSPTEFMLDNGFHLVSFALDEGIYVNDIGWDRTYRCGGLEIAEVVLFATELDPSVRRSIEVALMEKWLPSLAHPSAATPMQIANYSGSVLDAGRDVEIGNLNAGGAVFVKSGAGEVLVDSFASLAGVDIREGTMDFSSGVDGILKGAFFHIDPSVASSLVFDSTGNVCRVDSLVGDGNYASNTYNAQSGAELESISVGGRDLKLLDFGPYYSCTNGMFTNNAPVEALAPAGVSAMDWRSGTDGLKSFFIVVEENEIHPQAPENAIKDQYLLGYVGGPDFDRSSRFLMSPDNASVYASALKSVKWKLDGLPVSSERTVMPAGLHVISCVIPDGQSPVRANRFAQDQGNRIGGLKYGEVVVFNRSLSAEEEDAVNAYLIGKWLGGESYSVEMLLDTADLHLDPSNADTLEHYVDGGGVTNMNEVVAIRDTRSYRPVVASLTPHSRANATLVAAAPSGLDMLDFGVYDEVAIRRADNSCGMVWSDFEWGVKTVFLVISKTSVPGDAYANEEFVLGGRYGTNNYDFHSDSSHYLASWASGAVQGAQWEVDGVRVSPTVDAWAKDTVEVVSIRSGGFMYASQLGQDRDARIGGVRYGEVLLFADALGDADCAKIRNYLMEKWLGRQGGEIPSEESQAAVSVMSSMSFGQGAGLSFGGNLEIADGGQISIELPARNSAIADVGGIFRFGTGVAVAITVAPGGRVQAGTYPLLSAASFEDAENFTGWTLDDSALVEKGLGAAISSGSGQINLVVRSRGMVIIVK